MVTEFPTQLTGAREGHFLGVRERERERGKEEREREREREREGERRKIESERGLGKAISWE